MLAVADHLDLDVAGVGHQPLDVDPLDAEAARLGGAAGIGLGQIPCVQHRAHAAATATAQRLDHHPRAGLPREEVLRLRQRDGARAAGQQRHTALPCQRPGARLVAEQRQLFHRGADEGETGLAAGLREVGALAQESVAGMDRVAAALARDRDDVHGVEVSSRAGSAQCHRVVGEPDMRRLRVVGRVHRDAGRAEVAHGAHQTESDLAPVGYQDLAEHQAGSFSNRRSTLPAPVAGSASMKRTSRGAL